MARFVIIADGVVDTAIAVDEALVLEGFTVEGKVLVQSDTAQPGDLWDGTQFSTPAPTPVPIQQQIAALEATMTPRRQREALLTDAGREWLADVDAQIAALRAQL